MELELNECREGVDGHGRMGLGLGLGICFVNFCEPDLISWLEAQSPFDFYYLFKGRSGGIRP